MACCQPDCQLEVLECAPAAPKPAVPHLQATIYPMISHGLSLFSNSDTSVAYYSG